MLGACGGSEPGTGSSDEASPTDPVSSSTPSDTTDAAVADAQSAILGVDSGFSAGGGGAEPLTTDVEGRECVLADLLNGSCRAASGASGDFVVTAEGSLDSPGEWNVVVRCGLQPAVPAASVHGAFTPVIADLGLAPYGDVIGITLLGGSGAEAALVYQPEGSDCPVVWGLGPVDGSNIFTGGTDALNGSEQPIWFRDAQGADACAVADGQGGITVGAARGDGSCA